MKNKRQKGQTLVEYGLIMALLGALLLTSLTLMRNSISNTFSKTVSELGAVNDN